MYNTNKVSPPFIPNQFLVKEPNPEGLSAGGWEGGYALGRNSGYKMHSSKQRQKPSSAYQSLGKAHTHHLGSWQPHRSESKPSRAGVPLFPELGRMLAGTALLGKRGGEHTGASTPSTGWRGQASACKQHIYFSPKHCHNHFEGPWKCNKVELKDLQHTAYFICSRGFFMSHCTNRHTHRVGTNPAKEFCASLQPPLALSCCLRPHCAEVPSFPSHPSLWALASLSWGHQQQEAPAHALQPRAQIHIGMKRYHFPC